MSSLAIAAPAKRTADHHTANKRGVRHDRVGAFAFVGPRANSLDVLTQAAAAPYGLEASVLTRHIFGDSGGFALILDAFAFGDDGGLGVAERG